MQRKFVLITGRHDDAVHRTARGRFASERDATAYAEDARRRGEFDWWVVAELDSGRVASSSEPPSGHDLPLEVEPVTANTEAESHAFLVPIDSSTAPN